MKWNDSGESDREEEESNPALKQNRQDFLDSFRQKHKDEVNDITKRIEELKKKEEQERKKNAEEMNKAEQERKLILEEKLKAEADRAQHEEHLR